MSTFGGVYFTNKGRALQAKALTGVQLNFTKIVMGDGSLTGQAIQDLTALIHEVKTLSITTLKNTNDGNVTIGGVLSNQGLASGFYWRELGLFAQDPDLGEILYSYGNAAALAEYIPAGGGADLLEKQINIVAIIGNATSVSATINESLVYATVQEVQGKISHSLATAVNDFLVASAVGQYVKKTLAEVKTILGLGSAAYQNTSTFATSTQGTKADNAIPSSEKGVAGGVASYDEVASSLADNLTQLELKANETDNARITTSKTVTGAINELFTKQIMLKRKMRMGGLI